MNERASRSNNEILQAPVQITAVVSYARAKLIHVIIIENINSGVRKQRNETVMAATLSVDDGLTIERNYGCILNEVAGRNGIEKLKRRPS